MKLSEHIHKIREFYTKDRNLWGQGALLLDSGEYCLLGAAACVVTNKDAIDNNKFFGEFSTLGDWRDLSGVHGAAELIAFEDFFEKHTPPGENNSPMAIETWNDQPDRTRAQVLTKLRSLETLALEAEVTV